MNKNNFCVLVVTVIMLLQACSFKSSDKGNTSQEPQSKVVNNSTATSLDSILRLSEFYPSEGYLNTPDGGVMYNPDLGNTLGNAYVVMVPLTDITIAYSSIDSLEDAVTSMSINELKCKYNVYISIIDKDYLEYYKDGDFQYYPRSPYLITLYWFDCKKEYWSKLESQMIDEDSYFEEWLNPFKEKYVTHKFEYK